jgi:competence protein ComEA
MKKLVMLVPGLISPALLWAGPVNINTADAEAISRELQGVGMSKAQAIVDYRAKNGDFAAPEDLLKVKGIGQSILEKNRSDILVAD